MNQNTKDFILKYKHALWFILYAIESFGYFVAQKIADNPTMVYSKLDDYIPFCVYFIVPYLLWYVYIGGALGWFFLKSREEFIRLCIFLYVGMYTAVLIFILFPTGVSFRPSLLEENNIFAWMTNQIYLSDEPLNVCPSLHCYESIVVHICIAKSQFLKDKKYITIPSFVLMILICLSTVFIKQHSIIDVFCGVLLVVPAYLIAFKSKFVKERIIKG